MFLWAPAHQSLLSAPTRWDRKKSPPEARGRLPSLGLLLSGLDSISQRAPRHGSRPLPSALTGVVARRLPASVPPAAAEVVGSAAALRALQPGRLGTSKPSAGGER